MKYLIYIVEDEKGIRESEAFMLRREGHEVEEFSDGNSVLLRCEDVIPDVIVLDWMLPDISGVEVLRQLRKDARLKRIPVIMVTAKRESMDIVKGLDEGADDYLMKPFDQLVLAARVNALIRRSHENHPFRGYGYRDIHIDPEKRIAAAAGQPLELSETEYSLLDFFVQHADMAVSRDQIMNALWEENYQGESRAIDMHVNRLRKKLISADAELISVWGVGYKLV